MRSLAVFSCIVASWRPATAQQASPYVPLHHWATPYAEHLIARGAIADPTPLSRPFRAADLVHALRDMDSVRVTQAEWRVAQRLIAELDRGGEAPLGRVEGHASLAAATHALRDPLGTRCRPTASGCAARDPDASRVFASGGLAATLFLGPVVAVTHPYFDTRLKFDPDWYGRKERFVAGRNAEAYLDAQLRFIELFFGSLDRNWGPSDAPGILLSDSPYDLDHAALRVGTSGVQLEGTAAQLNDLVDTAGAVHHRYLIQHRLWIRPPGRWTLAAWEAFVLSGVGRSLEMWYLNILNLGMLTQVNTRANANTFLGFDFERKGSVTVFGQAMLDDIQIDRQVPSDRKPTSYAFTIGARGGGGGGVPRRSVAWRAYYTQVSNLAYRNEDDLQVPLHHGLGTGRDFADYDQLTARVSAMAGAGLLVEPEVTWLRQGEGDPRLPHPPVASYPGRPTMFEGVVERTLRLALAARYDRGPLSLSTDAGVHLVSNANHVSGESDQRFVGRVGITYRFRKESVLP
jgi:hypothetical protein